ncbi:MAG: hypothetical protein KGJ78_13300 [Alphaproteobacteria bacterium]|nr:hypothetical protein [Alphaproteobacteria bacterium]
MYALLARSEEREALAELGSADTEYKRAVPGVHPTSMAAIPFCDIAIHTIEEIIMRIMSAMPTAVATALLLAAISPALTAGAAPVPGYRLELVGPAHPAGPKQHAVSTRIIRASDNKPVIGAAITSVRLDMGPENMAAMTAPVRQAPAVAPGIYSFLFDDSMVWTERAKWALTITATVKGEPKPVTTSVVFQAGQ